MFTTCDYGVTPRLDTDHHALLSAADYDDNPLFRDISTAMVDDKWIGLALAVSGSAAIGASSIITKKVRHSRRSRHSLHSSSRVSMPPPTRRMVVPQPRTT